MKFYAAKRILEVSLVKSETYVVRRNRRCVAFWCSICDREVEMLDPEDVSAMTGVSKREIYSDIEAGLAHFSESSDGTVLVCLSSVMKTRQKRGSL